MGIQIYRPLVTTNVVYPALVFTRDDWDDDWTIQPEMRATEINVCSASHGVSQCTLSRPYGWVKQPWESAVVAKKPWKGGISKWVAVALCDGNGWEFIFHGRIDADSRDLHGSDNGPSGVQTWTARGPIDILGRIHVSQSTWEVGNTIKTLDWIPPLNIKNASGTVDGNRSDSELLGDNNTSHHYGGDSEWNYLDYLRYILAQFVNGDSAAEDAITWTVGGMYSLLANLTEPITFKATQTVAEILNKLIPRNRGLDYMIGTTDDGFEIRVFSLNSKTVSFGSVNLPANPYKVDFDAGDSGLHYSVQVAESADQQYGKIRVLGKRLVTCCSIGGTETDVTAGLVAGWDSTVETEYQECTELDIPDADAAGAIAVVKKYRQQNRFRSVYRVFAGNDDFLGFIIKTPWVSVDGTIYDSASGDYQYKIRKTLDWVPLYENVVYGVSEGSDVTQAMYSDETGEKQPELIPPMAWIGPPSDEETEEDELPAYRPVEKIGANVSALKNHFGLFLEATPNHLLAGEALSWTDLTAYHDWNTLIITAAFETDQRLRLEHDIPGGDSSRVKEIEIDAEAWWLSKDTVVGLDVDNQPIVNTAGRELRNDKDKMEAAMAGAIARYGNRRARASISLNDIALWSNLVGCILDTVTSGDIPHEIKGPITNVTWSIPLYGNALPRTTVNTGYAR